MADTEYISKEAALACFTDWIDRYGHEHSADEMVEYQMIEDLPAADVVEVVRCRDCRKRDFCRTSTVWAVAPKDDWFCADGERRCEHDPNPSDSSEVP